MGSGHTSIWGRPIPLESDAPDAAADITALANSLETVSLYPTTAASSRALIAGESALTSAGVTVTTSATPTKGDFVQVIAAPGVSGSSPATVALGGGKVANGRGLSSATSLLLGTPGANITIQYDGTNWRVLQGQQDSGWLALTLAGASKIVAESGSDVPAARAVGDRVQLRGACENQDVTPYATPVTLPTATRPAKKCGFVTCLNPPGGSHGSLTSLGWTVDSTGAVTGGPFPASASGIPGIVYFDGVEFSLVT